MPPSEWTKAFLDLLTHRKTNDRLTPEGRPRYNFSWVRLQTDLVKKCGKIFSPEELISKFESMIGQWIRFHSVVLKNGGGYQRRTGKIMSKLLSNDDIKNHPNYLEFDGYAKGLKTYEQMTALWSGVPSLVELAIKCMELLLKAGADPNLASFEKTALIVAACVGDTAIIKRLLKAGANPNVVDTSGMTPFEQAALRGNIAAMTALFPRTSPISSFPDWSVNGIVRHVLSEEGRTQSEIKRMNDFEVSKAKGREAFERKDYEEAILWYSEANVADPSDANVLSNRSLCWAKLNQGYQALKDAEDCVALKPNWAMAHYREGAEWMLFHEYYIASEIFSRALKLDPNKEDIKKAHRVAVEAESRMPVSGNRYL